MNATIFFAGAPQGGYQAFPAHYQREASVLDLPEGDPTVYLEIHKIQDRNRMRYVYRRTDVRTKDGGRPGSSFSIWLELEGYEWLRWGPAQFDFFDTLFQKGIVEAGKVLQEDSDGRYFFTSRNLSDQATTLEDVIERAIRQFRQRFPPGSNEFQPIAAPNRRQQQLLGEHSYREQVDPLGPPEQVEQDSGSDASATKQTAKTKSKKLRQKVLEQQLRFFQGLSGVLVLVVIILLILLRTRSTVSEQQSEWSNRADSTALRLAETSVESSDELLVPTQFSSPATQVNIPSRLRCCLRQREGSYFLTTFPEYEDARLFRNAPDVEAVLEQLVGILWQEYDLPEQGWSTNPEELVRQLAAYNPSDTERLRQALDRGAMDYLESFQVLLSREDFLLYRE